MRQDQIIVGDHSKAVIKNGAEGVQDKVQDKILEEGVNDKMDGGQFSLL